MPSAKRLTIYSFGYWGWGTATDKLVRLMDTAEKARGKQAPFFVDVRARRNVHAPGFRGNAFGDLVGPDRYKWMPELGNKRVLDHKPGLAIIKPSAAKELLDLAEERARKKQPVAFYCACEWPYFDGVLSCHRAEISRMLLAKVKKRTMSVDIHEWPGGKGKEVELEIRRDLYRKVINGARHIPIDDGTFLMFVDLPWGSIASIHCKEEDDIFAITGPPKWNTKSWNLPVLHCAWTRSAARKTASKVRQFYGLT